MVALTAVRAVTSEARLLREAQPAAVAAGLRAVEQSHCLETRMPVEVVAPPGRDVEALLDGLDRSRLLRRAERGGYAKARVYLLPKRSRAGNGPVPMLDLLREETWAVVGEDGNLLAPSIPDTSRASWEPCWTTWRRWPGIASPWISRTRGASSPARWTSSCCGKRPMAWRLRRSAPTAGRSSLRGSPWR